MHSLSTFIEHADFECVVGHVNYSVPLEIEFYFIDCEPPELHITDLILKTDQGDKRLPEWLPYRFEEAIQEQLLSQREKR